MAVIEHAAKELTYEQYQYRQCAEIDPEKLKYRAESLRNAKKFYLRGSKWQGYPYNGYSIVSMVNENPQNSKLNIRLKEIQDSMSDRLICSTKLCFLPPSSFHQTIANTLSGARFGENIIDKGLGAAFPSLIAEAVASLPVSTAKKPIEMKMMGLSIFSNAIGMLGVFASQEDFAKILSFRDAVYENSALNRIGIERTRPFIGHITLAYLEGELTDQEKQQLVYTCCLINQSIKRQRLRFYIQQAELRSYVDLSDFHADPEYPVYSFITKS